MTIVLHHRGPVGPLERRLPVDNGDHILVTVLALYFTSNNVDMKVEVPNRPGQNAKWYKLATGDSGRATDWEYDPIDYQYVTIQGD